jgi:large subunit ribosomal protein L9
MKVILLKSVPKLGKKDDILTVPDGYAQNALLPKKLAMIATDQAVAALQRTQQNTIAQKEVQHALLDKAVESLIGKTLIYKAKTNEKGSLFSKIDETDIRNILLEQENIAIDHRIMKIVDGPIKQTGTYALTVIEGKYHNTFSIEVK